jgi:hypothetical protein
MYRSVGDDTNTALFTDDYMSQATQVTHSPLMLDPPKRTAHTVTANAVPPPVRANADASDSTPMTSSAVGDSLVMFGLLGIVAVAGIYFFSRKG